MTTQDRRNGGHWALSPIVTIRLWPMPDLSRPPLHDLPRAELVACLGALTNLRVVRDPDDSDGYLVRAGPFPGWGTVPEC